MDSDEAAAWAIVFSEQAGGGTFDFESETWRKPGENEDG